MSAKPCPFSLHINNEHAILPVTEADVTCEHDDFSEGCASIVSFHRRVESQDAHHAPALEADVFKRHWLKHFEEGCNLAFKFVFNNQIAGFVTFGPIPSLNYLLAKEQQTGKWGQLHNLCVTEEYRGKGFGSDLYNHALAVIGRQKNWAWLLVEPPPRENVIGFFRSRGVTLLHYPDQPNLKIGIVNLKEVLRLPVL